ncbi:Type IV pili [Telmatospirillum siberiense]|uniref:Type IV pili n=2 Tax=Telmatospirillum siberiense TaxID=382514 RepID=A0A2N3PNK8_9PROT|nr:Type IV pili [Telmatospirillum siberiense]
MNVAALMYDLPEPILWSIAQVEGGQVGSVVRNANNTVDLGIMQINSSNLPDLEAFYGVDRRLLATRLVHDGCFNIKMGAWLLKRRMVEAHDFWVGVGWYHSHTPPLAIDYIRKVSQAAVRLYGDGVFQRPGAAMNRLHSEEETP